MWDAILDGVFWVIQMFYNICADWGLAIIIITVIFRLAITPLMIKQTKSSFDMQKIQPRIKDIQMRFPNDPTRQNEEMQRLYAEAKYNPLAGCIPMFIQMPLFIALFQVLRSMGDRVGSDTVYCFYNIVPNLVMSPSEAFAQGFPAFVPYIILLLVFALATFVPTFLMQRSSTDKNQRRQTLIMSVGMSFFMLWIGWTSPAGVLLFWGVSSLLAIAQTQGSMAYFRSQDKKVEAEKAAAPTAPVVVNVERRTQKKRQTKKH